MPQFDGRLCVTREDEPFIGEVERSECTSCHYEGLKLVTPDSVLRADLNVRVASTSTSPGNPALLRCEVSRAAREYVEVKEWTMDGAKVTLHDFGIFGHRGKT